MKTLLLSLLFFTFLSPSLLPQEEGIPNSLTPRGEVSQEYRWSVEDLYPSVEAWEKEFNTLPERFSQIVELAKEWTSSPSRMADFLEKRSRLDIVVSRLYCYASFLKDTDLGDTQAQRMIGRLQSETIEQERRLSFMEPDVLRLSSEKVQEYLRVEPRLLPYRRMLDRILKARAHILPTEQEEITRLASLFSDVSERVSSLLNDLEIPPATVTLKDGKNLVLTGAAYQFYRGTPVREDRRLVLESYWKNKKSYENTFAALLDGEMKHRSFFAKTHGYENNLEAALQPNTVDTKVYTHLIEQVHNNLQPLHRYLRLKRELLNLSHLHYYDLYASSVPSASKTYTYEQAKTTLLKAFVPLGKEYTSTVRKAFDERWIDVYPNKGKQTGLYSNGGAYEVHPYILMNFNGTYGLMNGLAHELGHTLHSYLSNTNQPYPTSRYPTFLAEVASTFNENLLLDHLLKTEQDDLFKLNLLDGYLDNLRSTIYRQTLFAEFELFMNDQVEKGETLTAKELNQKYLELTKTFYGEDQGVMVIDPFIENEWGSIPHFFMNYYVYQYSTGLISSLALSESVLTGGEKQRQIYLNFLKSGSVNDPLEALKIAGVDITSPATYTRAFKRYATLLDEMERLVKKLKVAGKLSPIP